MRHLLAFSGWSNLDLPRGAWLWADTMGRPVTLAHALGKEEALEVGSNEQRTVHAVVAGSIYNARQLRTSLAGRHALSGRDDAEVVVHLYEERGVQCVKALRGAFTLALWDERRQRMLLARDQLGLVPLYYAADGGCLAAASTLAPLLALSNVAGTWDPAALDAFMTLGSVPAPTTFYTGIRQLGPGELALWEDGRLRTQRYWQLTFPERRMSRPDVAPLLLGQMQEALRLRQLGVVSGLLLSGGIDAAALLALATAEQRLPARTYTAAFAGSPDAEAEEARRLAALAGVEHVAVTDEPDWAALVDEILAVHGGPVGGPDLAALHVAARRARADVGVVLAGVGAEEVLGGSRPVRMAERMRRFRELPGLAREAAQLWARLGRGGRATDLRRLVDDERLAPFELYARGIRLLSPDERSDLYTPETLAALGETHPADVVTALFGDAAAVGATATLDALHFVELSLRLPARATAALAAAAGLDLRLPLADHRLAQFAASVPPASRGSATERQLLLRAALGERLPGRRPHASALLPARAWEALLDQTRVEAHGFFRPAAVARLRDEHLAGRHDHAAKLWAIVLATRWLERQPGASSLGVRQAG